MSPPPLTAWFAEPPARRMSLARSIAQPLPAPDGSGRPAGRTVKSPWLASARAEPSAKTDRTSASQSAAVRSPRSSRLIWLSDRYVEKVRSTRCSHSTASVRTVGATSSRRSNETTVPMTCSTWRVGRRPVGSRPGTAATPLTGRPGPSALQGLDVAKARVRRAGNHVDVGVLRAERLRLQHRNRVAVDLLVAAGGRWVPQHRYGGDLLVGDGDLHLDRAVLGADRAAGDLGPGCGAALTGSATALARAGAARA